MATREITIQVGQFWQDLDPRNSGKVNKKGRWKNRVVEIVRLPTLSTPGVMKVAQAPNNPKSVGQLREFTRGKLLAHYALIKD